MSDLQKDQPFQEFLEDAAAAPDVPTNVVHFHRTCKTCRTFQRCWDRKSCRQVEADHGFCA